jgi:hypothetical protein
MLTLVVEQESDVYAFGIMLYEIFRFDGLPIHFFQLRAPQKFKRLLLLGPFLGVH